MNFHNQPQGWDMLWASQEREEDCLKDRQGAQILARRHGHQNGSSGDLRDVLEAQWWPPEKVFLSPGYLTKMFALLHRPSKSCLERP